MLNICVARGGGLAGPCTAFGALKGVRMKLSVLPSGLQAGSLGIALLRSRSFAMRSIVRAWVGAGGCAADPLARASKANAGIHCSQEFQNLIPIPFRVSVLKRYAPRSVTPTRY